MVLTDTPGNKDIFDLTGCGIMAKNKDPYSMADGLMSLYTTAQLYKEQRELAHRKVTEFEWNKIAQMY